MIYIILPTHKRTQSTAMFLQSITNNLKEKHLVILIDDDADRENTKAFKGRKDVKIIEGDGNLWWGGAINKGIDYLLHSKQPSPNDICVFANNDVEITADTINPILKQLKTQKKALYHPRVTDKQGKDVSAGSKIISWFPYLTRHPKSFARPLVRIDLATGRFLCFNAEILKKTGLIHADLPHYGGDNYFSLRAKQLGFPTYLVRDAVCRLDVTKTGLNLRRIKTLKELWRSFFTIRSANNVLFRYRFLNTYFHNPFFALVVLISMLFNIIIKFTLRRIFRPDPLTPPKHPRMTENSIR